MVRYKRGDYEDKIKSAYRSLKYVKKSYDLWEKEEDLELKSVYLGGILFYYYDICEFIVMASEEYAIRNNKRIEPENYKTILNAAEGLFDGETIKFMQSMLFRRNRVNHDFYKRERELRNILALLKNNFNTLESIIDKYVEYINKEFIYGV